MQSGGRGESTFTRGSRIMVMRLTVVICLVFSICASTVHANEKDSLDMADASIIFGTGLALQVGSLALGTVEGAEPVAYLGFMGAGIVMDIVGDSLGHNGNMFWTFTGTLAGTVVGAGLGWAVGTGWEKNPPSKTEAFLGTAAIFSIGPLLGTLAYHWSNTPKTSTSARLMPLILESPDQERVQGLSLIGTF